MIHRIALLASALVLNPLVFVDASTLMHSGSIRIEAASEGGALSIKNARLDRDSVLRGTAYVNFGYATPRVAHVHAYGLSSSGEAVAQGADKLSATSFSRHPHRTGWRHDAFAIVLRGQLDKVRVVRIVAHVGKLDG